MGNNLSAANVLQQQDSANAKQIISNQCNSRFSTASGKEVKITRFIEIFVKVRFDWNWLKDQMKVIEGNLPQNTSKHCYWLYSAIAQNYLIKITMLYKHISCRSLSHQMYIASSSKYFTRRHPICAGDFSQLGHLLLWPTPPLQTWQSFHLTPPATLFLASPDALEVIVVTYWLTDLLTYWLSQR